MPIIIITQASRELLGILPQSALIPSQFPFCPPVLVSRNLCSPCAPGSLCPRFPLARCQPRHETSVPFCPCLPRHDASVPSCPLTVSPRVCSGPPPPPPNPSRRCPWAKVLTPSGMMILLSSFADRAILFTCFVKRLCWRLRMTFIVLNTSFPENKTSL